VPDDVPDYHSIISEPMDLGTVAAQLQQGRYTSPSHVLQDVQLVWDNCAEYNTRSSGACV